MSLAHLDQPGPTTQERCGGRGRPPQAKKAAPFRTEEADVSRLPTRTRAPGAAAGGIPCGPCWAEAERRVGDSGASVVAAYIAVTLEPNPPCQPAEVAELFQESDNV